MRDFFTAHSNKGLAPVLWVIIAAVVLGSGLFAVLLPRILHPVNDDRGQFEFMVAEETKNWKTYRNEKYGFEFRYPPEWERCNLTVSKVAESLDFLQQQPPPTVGCFQSLTEVGPFGVTPFMYISTQPVLSI